MPSAIRFFSDTLKIFTNEQNGLHLRGCCRLQSNKLMLPENKRKNQWLKQILRGGKPQRKQWNWRQNRYNALCKSVLRRSTPNFHQWRDFFGLLQVAEKEPDEIRKKEEEAIRLEAAAAETGQESGGSSRKGAKKGKMPSVIRSSGIFKNLSPLNEMACICVAAAGC